MELTFMDLIGRFAWEINKNGQVYLAKELKKYNIGGGQQPVLMVLYKKDNITQDEISQFLDIDKSATTKAITKLLDEGYIKREIDPHDKRTNRIFLTKKAIKIKQDLMRIVMTWQDILCAGLSDEEKETAIKLLKRIGTNSKNHIKGL